MLLTVTTTHTPAIALGLLTAVVGSPATLSAGIRTSSTNCRVPAGGVSTVKGLCERYLASERLTGAREATRHEFSRIVKIEILPALGERELPTIAPADLADWAQGFIERERPRWRSLERECRTESPKGNRPRGGHNAGVPHGRDE